MARRRQLNLFCSHLKIPLVVGADCSAPFSHDEETESLILHILFNEVIPRSKEKDTTFASPLAVPQGDSNKLVS